MSILFALLLATVVIVTTGPAAAEEAAAPVLDTAGFWRVHCTMRLPVLLVKGKVVALEEVATGNYVKPPVWIRSGTPLPHPDWFKPDFDDSRWPRLAGLPTATRVWERETSDRKSAFAALECVRGKFTVNDPAQAAGLTLSLEYRGGVAVYVNGTKILTRDLESSGAGGPDELAVPVREGETGNRTITGLAIPPAVLRRGVNVLALELHRAPVRENDIVINNTKWPQGVVVKRATCGLETIRLSAPKALVPGVVVPNVTRPGSFQVWNNDVMSTDYDMDFGDPNEPLGPVRIVGTCGGVFNGKVVVGCDREIKGLRASVSDLRNGKEGRIAASSVTIRYAWPLGREVGSNYRYLAPVTRVEALDEIAPDPAPVYEKLAPAVVPGSRLDGWYLKSPGVAPAPGAVVPVWAAVHVPRDAAPGDYRGTLTITAEGQTPVSVPLQVSVSAWPLPDPKTYATFAEVVQSPETLAIAYNVPLWSDEHFGLIDRSLALTGSAGAKTVHICLIAETNLGNAETIVRWVKTGEGTYRHDFTALDRYMDLVEKHLGKPPVVCLYVWEKFLTREASRGQWEGKDQEAAIKGAMGKGPGVTVVDPATGETSTLYPGPWGDRHAQALWRPLAEGLLKRLGERGLRDSAMLGIMCDYMPSAETVDALAALFPGVKWISQAHPAPHATMKARTGYISTVFEGTRFDDPSERRLLGWRRPEMWTQFWRYTRNDMPITTFRFMGETSLLAGYRGFARMGGDFFPVFKNKRGELVAGVSARYPKSYWNNLNVEVAFFARGERGAIPTARFEMLREGIQESEARIFIERALADDTLRGRLGDDLAKRAQDVLDERARALRRGISTWSASGGYVDWAMGNSSWWQAPAILGAHWYIGSGWQERSKTLFDTAAEVQQATR